MRKRRVSHFKRVGDEFCGLGYFCGNAGKNGCHICAVPLPPLHPPLSATAFLALAACGSVRRTAQACRGLEPTQICSNNKPPPQPLRSCLGALHLAHT